jgi:hypothetical protein
MVGCGLIDQLSGLLQQRDTRGQSATRLGSTAVPH